MLIVLSPAKTLDFDSPAEHGESTLPGFLPDTARLVDQLRRYRPARLGRLMSISDRLAELNAQRYRDFSPEFDTGNARPAFRAFAGDVYEGLQAGSLDAAGWAWAQAHVRVLSGLYGLLRPRDLIQPYRLEMGTRLKTRRGADLYAFWGPRLGRELRALAAPMPDPTLVNLASDEYFRAVDRKAFAGPVVQPVFEEPRPDAERPWAVISFMAKRARGAMTRFAIDERIDRAEDLKAFDRDGYRYVAGASTDIRWVFRREPGAARTSTGSGSSATA